MNFAHLRAVREYELRLVLPLLPRGGAILEIGAGAGWQASKLAERGFTVEAIDLAASDYAEHQVWPVRSYDGHRIPFDAGSFDVVFSSNVLEHVPHLEAFQAELHRVLKPGGIAVHVVPSGSWRFWTSLTHYGDLLRQVKWEFEAAPRAGPWRCAMSAVHRVRRSLRPPRHGERGTAVTEIYYFSRWFWAPFFERTGWRVVACRSNELFYTGHSLLGPRLGLRQRRLLSRIAGGSCAIYVLKKATVASGSAMAVRAGPPGEQRDETLPARESRRRGVGVQG